MLSMLRWTCRLRSIGSCLGAVVGVICVGGFGWKSAWCSGREGIGIIVVGIGSPSSEYRSLLICCLKASTAVRISGETSVSVEVLEEVRWVSVGRAGGGFTGDAWWCIAGGGWLK